MSKKFEVWFNHDKEDLEKRGFKEKPEDWEDGMRTDGGIGSYEWWYMDGKFDDGSTLGIVFYTKPMDAINSDMAPMIELDIMIPGKEEYTKINSYLPSEFSADKDKCNVKIGKNIWTGNLKNQTIHIERPEENIVVDVKMTSECESWRSCGSGDGQANYGETGGYIGWFIAMPQGHIEATITKDGKTVTKTGSCYHDHNWGNVPIQDIKNHWYWSRTKIGPYTIIGAYQCLPQEYDLYEYSEIMLAKDGKIVADKSECMTFWRSTPHIQPVTGAFASDDIMFIYDDKGDGFRLILRKEKNLMNEELIPDEKTRELLKQKGYHLVHHRMTGTAELDIIKDTKVVETLNSDSAVWEMTQFRDPDR